VVAGGSICKSRPDPNIDSARDNARRPGPRRTHRAIIEEPEVWGVPGIGTAQVTIRLLDNQAACIESSCRSSFSGGRLSGLLLGGLRRCFHMRCAGKHDPRAASATRELL